MKKWIPYLILALSLGLNAGLLTMDFCGHGHGRYSWTHRVWDRIRGTAHQRRLGKPPDAAEMIERRIRDMTEVLKLDDTQQKGVREILNQSIPQLNALMESMGRNRVSLKAEFSKPDLDQERIRALELEWSKLRDQVDSVLTESALRQMSLFSVEQRENYVNSRLWMLGGPPRKPSQRPTPPMPVK